jgi:hypothetical protein
MPGPNLHRLLVDLNVEREPVWLATQRHHLVHHRHIGSCAIIGLIAGYDQASDRWHKSLSVCKRRHSGWNET